MTRTTKKIDNTMIGVGMSHEEPFLQSLVIVIHGAMGAGKTTLAVTASKHFPDELPDKRVSGDPNIICDDMVWLSFDSKATAGFKERGISVPNFDVPNFMTNEELWKAAKFKSAPSVIQAAEFGASQMTALKPQWVVVDTLSAYDFMLFNHLRTELDDRVEAGRMREIRANFVLYDRMKKYHQAFFQACRKIAPSVIFLCHSKAEMPLEDKEAEQRADTLKTAAGGTISPAITGQSKILYKGQASLILSVETRPITKAGKKTLERSVSPIPLKGRESKNRYELSLDAREPAHLTKIFKKIQAQ